MADGINRKEFFKRLGILGISAVSVSTFLEACGGNRKPDTQGSDLHEPQSNNQTESKPKTQPKKQADPCTDVSGLSKADLKNRQNLKYEGKTTFPGKDCSNCQFYIAPHGGGSCGTCQVVKGPINPKGHCSAWVAKQKA